MGLNCSEMNVRQISLRLYPIFHPHKYISRMLHPHQTELFKHRSDEKSRNKGNYISNTAEFLVVGSCSQGFQPSLLVKSENKTYLFNCSEGLQRFCYSNKIKLMDLEHVFVTNHTWNRVSGTYGLYLTLRDIGSVGLTIHSTPEIKDFFRMARSFISFDGGTSCSTRDFLGGDYKDSGIHVKPIALDSNQELENEDNITVKKTKVRQKLVTYVCSLPDVPGKLDPKRCRELNVPIGPLLGVLKSGKDVTLPNGRLVKSADVCSPPSKGLKFIVLECPKKSDISAITGNTNLENLRVLRDDERIKMVVHFSPDEVTSSSSYREWMEGFPEDCKHLLVVNDVTKWPNLLTAYRHQYLMRKLDDVIFPDLYLPKELKDDIERELGNSSKEPLSYGLGGSDTADLRTVLRSTLQDMDRITKTSALDKIVFRPNESFETVCPHKLMDLQYREALANPDFDECLEKYRELQKKCLPHKIFEPELVFLGTGSAVPSKYRNTSCILLNFQAPREASVILDCGEDSYGQMVRLYGPDGANKILKQLLMVYVSHHHADHHMGLVELLRNRSKLTDQPVLLIVPPGIEFVLNYHNENFEDLKKTYIVYNTAFLRDNPRNLADNGATSMLMKSDMIEKMNGLLKDIKVVHVNHCVNSCAVVMEFAINEQDMKTFTVAYSGDARPSSELIRAGKGCDLLIHEATFDHRDISEAISKKHSTAKEAIVVSKEMEAKFTILTHFSQRIPRIPSFSAEYDEKIGFALDNMTLRCPSHFQRLPIMKDILGVAFSRQVEMAEVRYAKHNTRQRAVEKFMETNKSSKAKN